MKIGYACIPLSIPYKTNRTYKLSTYSNEKAYITIKENLLDLKKILIYNSENNINFFRISSDIIPLASHPVFDFNWKKEFKKELKDIGEFINKNNMRITMHPGQYTILNSLKDDVTEKSIKDLLYHSEFLDSLSLDYSHTLTLHVGGVYGDRNKAIQRFIKNYNDLPPSIKNRLAIENDEKNFSFTDIYNISLETGVPVIFDNLHEECFHKKNLDNDMLNTILEKTTSTWNNKTPKVHYSQQDLNRKLGSHSKSIRTEEFLDYYNIIKNYNIDIMQEVKDKNISVLKTNNIISNFTTNELQSTLEKELDLYRYFLISRSFDTYILAETLAKDLNLLEFYNVIDNAITSPTDTYGNIYVLQSFLNILKEYSTSKELNYSNKLLKENNLDSLKSYINKLALRYNLKIQFDYYFVY